MNCTLKYSFHRILLLLLATILLSTCKPEFENPQWDVDLLAPLLKSSLTLNDIIADSISTVNADSTVSIMYDNMLYTLSLDSLFTFPDTTFTYIAKLDSLELGDISINYPISLGDIALQLISDGNFTGNLILLFNGSSMVIPSINNLTSGDVPIDAESYFQTITLQEGFMDITVQNNFPVDIKNITSQISNESDGSIISQYTFPYVAANTSETASVSLAGKTIEGSMIANLINLDVVGSGVAVPIDTSYTISIILKVRDLKPQSATAVFPAQEIVNKSERLVMDIPDVELTQAMMKAGTLKVEVFSTIKDTLYFRYQMPTATLNGISFDVSNNVAPAPTGGVSTFLGYYDFAGYDLDFTGINGDTINTLHHSLIGSIDSSGILRNISLSDSFYISVGIIDLVPQYAEGYIGQHTFDIGPDNVDIDIFKNIKSGTIDIENIQLNFSVNNGLGAEAIVLATSISSVNSEKGSTANLIAPSVINTPISINRATDNPYLMAFDTIKLNDNNSNAPTLIENLPDKLQYALQITTNPNGNIYAPNREDFVYSDKLINVNLQMELPLSLQLNQLKLVDTVEFEMSDITSNNMKEGTLTMIADNGFPFDVFIQLYLLDNNGTVMDSLFTTNTIAAANVNNKLKVTEKNRSKLLIPFDEEMMNQLIATKNMLVVASFTSNPANEYLKIYSDYTIDLKLIGDFNYKVK